MARAEITLATSYETIEGSIEDTPRYVFLDNFFLGWG